MDVRTVQLAAAPDDVAVLKIEASPHFFEGGEVQVHGPCADGAAAGHGDARFPEPCQQRAEHEHGSPHGLDQIIGRFRLERAGRDRDLPVFKDGGAAEQPEQLGGGADVPQVRDIRVRHGLVEQDAPHEDGQGRVFRAAHVHDAGQRNAAFDDQFVHVFSLPGCSGACR